MGSQSETLAIYIKITYLNKELWNIFQYRPQWAQLCQHVWASRNVSVHFQIKHLASFLSPYQIFILKTRKNDVFDEGKRYFSFSKHCDHNARNEKERNLTDLVSGSPTTLNNGRYLMYGTYIVPLLTSIRPHNIRLCTVDCGLPTADCGQWIQVHTSMKKLFCPYSNS